MRKMPLLERSIKSSTSTIHQPQQLSVEEEVRNRILFTEAIGPRPNGGLHRHRRDCGSSSVVSSSMTTSSRLTTTNLATTPGTSFPVQEFDPRKFLDPNQGTKKRIEKTRVAFSIIVIINEERRKRSDEIDDNFRPLFFVTPGEAKSAAVSSM